MEQPKKWERYQRQIKLKEVGEKGQEKLLQSKVLVIGAGGLGCPVLQYLAAAGVGTIGIVDDDVVSLSNLHRQILYSTDDVGKPKAERAAAVLKSLNPEIEIFSYNLRLTNKNALDIIAAYDIIVDGTDNFSTRYMINDACVLLDKPLVYGAISGYEGQVAVFNLLMKGGERSLNYRHLFPYPPQDSEVLNCAEGGVLGMLPGIIGNMQAAEVVKLITSIAPPLLNRLLIYNMLTNEMYQVALTAPENMPSSIPKDVAAFLNTDYDWACNNHTVTEITTDHFTNLLLEKSITIIDVREDGETPLIHEFKHLHIPLGQLHEKTEGIEGNTIITVCQTGNRSKQAANILSGIFKDGKKIYSLKGGIIHWKLKQQEQNL